MNSFSTPTQTKLLSEPEIIAASIPFEDMDVRGIYFLINNSKVVYVGQSHAILRRVAAHKAEGVKKFDSYSYLEHAGDLDELEFNYILKFNPRHNVNLPPNPNLKGIGFIADRYAIGKVLVNRWVRNGQVEPFHFRNHTYYNLVEVEAAMEGEGL